MVSMVVSTRSHRLDLMIARWSSIGSLSLRDIVWWGYLNGSFKLEAFHSRLKTKNATPHQWGLELKDVHMNSGNWSEMFSV